MKTQTMEKDVQNLTQKQIKTDEDIRHMQEDITKICTTLDRIESKLSIVSDDNITIKSRLGIYQIIVPILCTLIGAFASYVVFK